MHLRNTLITLLLPFGAFCQTTDAYKPATTITAMPGYTLAWHDEFNNDGRPDSSNWNYEKGFVRNEELQWYQPANATCNNGVLLIEGRREKVPNPRYTAGSSDWRRARQFAEYTSACITTKGLQQFGYGRFEVRARIDTALGAWPAIWTLGTKGPWPLNGEVDMMEFYRVNGLPTILANVAWGTEKRFVAKWNTQRNPLAHFTAADADWVHKFHVWRMDWNKDSIALFLDGELLNVTYMAETINADSTNPFTGKPMFLLLNLALGQNGGDPSASHFPIKYEVDYVRYWKKDN
ncbi:MAG TPA: glycoside hydrolase family 16 protein [Chitinophagaceae bacterium]|nr:glycoside hydrolase family 16 protein [Chitinophagaceae bacterium]